MRIFFEDRRDIMSNIRKSVIDENGTRIQRSFWVSKKIWDAAEGLPLSRTAIMEIALLEAVTSYKTELVKLEIEAQNILDEQAKLDIRYNIITARIAEIKEQQQEVISLGEKIEVNKKQAVIELNRLLEEYGNKLMPLQYEHIEALSGVKQSKIKEFLDATNYLPSEAELKQFFEE